MKAPHYFFVLSLIVLLSSCSKHIHVTFQEEKDGTGTIHLKPNKATSDTYVTINDSLVVADAFVHAVTIHHVPPGLYGIHYICDNTEYQQPLNGKMQLVVSENRKITQLIQIPPSNGWFWFYNTVVILCLTAMVVF